MTSFTVKLPVNLDKKLRAAARRRGERISTIVRRALEREIAADTTDFATMAAPHKGMFRGPGDLSTRGYGLSKTELSRAHRRIRQEVAIERASGSLKELPADWRALRR